MILTYGGNMKLYSTKELEPVLYGKFSVKVLEMKVKETSNCFKLHWHERLEILRVREGNLHVFVEDVDYLLKEDDLLIIYPCQTHVGYTEQQEAIYDVVMFDISDFTNNTWAGQYYLGPLVNGSVIFENLMNDKTLLACIDNIVETYRRYESANPLLVMGMIYEFLGMLYQIGELCEGKIQNNSHSFDSIAEYVELHFKEPISTRELSRKFGYNEAYFAREFKKAKGLTLTNYIQILRIEYAKKLLKNSNESIKYISYKSGFSDHCYFTRCFRKHMGTSPAEYRKNQF